MANKMAEEAMLKARNIGVGPVFSEGQLLTLSSYSKQHGVDPTEIITAYTDYVISEFSAKATAAEMVTHVELAVHQCPDPKVVIELYKKKAKRRPSGEDPKDKLERRFRALQTEQKRAASAHEWTDAQLNVFSSCTHQAWQAVHLPANPDGSEAGME